MSELFPQHPRTGEWETLKGRTLAPHEKPVDVQDQNFGDSRLNQSTATGNWASGVIVTTGMTRGGGTMVK